MVITAVQARQTTNTVLAASARAPLDQVYSQIETEARRGFGTTLIVFTPFSFPPGGSTDPASAPFLNELAANGFGLLAEVGSDGWTSLRVTW